MPVELESHESWYLIYTKPRQEFIADLNLARQGFTTYLPRVRILRKRGAFRAPGVEPFFPRYLFIRLSRQNDNWAPIRSTIGVASLVRFGSEPARVPFELVDRLKRDEGADGLHEIKQSSIAVGGRVRIKDGPLSGYEGILLARSGQERAVLLLNLLGRPVRATLLFDDIESDGLAP